MKKLALLIFILMLMPMSFAKIEQFSTPINVSVFNNTFRIGTEDKQSLVYSSGTNLKEVVNAKFYRNTSCREEKLYDYITTVTKIYNGSSVSIFELDACKSDVKTLRSLAYMANTSLTYKDQLTTCSAVTTPIATPVAQIDPINNAQCIAAINQARTTAPPPQEDSGFIFPLIIGGLIGYFIGRGNWAKGPADGMNRIN